MEKRYEHEFHNDLPGGSFFREWLKGQEEDGWELAAATFGLFTVHGRSQVTAVIKRPVE